MANPRQALTLDAAQERSPAYKALAEAGLIVRTYLVSDPNEIECLEPNAHFASNTIRRAGSYIGGVFIGGLLYDFLFVQFSVNEGNVRLVTHPDGSFHFCGPGVYRFSRFYWTVGPELPLTTTSILHGNRAIVTVAQGFVGLAFDQGHPVLLAPGMHQWRSNTLKLDKIIDLSTDVIRIGPFTLVTVDEGYAAITQDNGKQRVLNGGSTHMLTHRNWKFEKFVTVKIHTDGVGPFQATTADNIVLNTLATVNWRVSDPALAARMAADTMPMDSANPNNNSCNVVGNNPQQANAVLRSDVLRQCVASLAAAIGGIRYSDDVHVSASSDVAVVDTVPPKATGTAEMFSVQQMTRSAIHANEICGQYGVTIMSINITSAVPQDKALEEAMSSGAVAAAGAQQAEIAARGSAKARLILAQSEAEATRISALAKADAELYHAQGKRSAASELEVSDVSVDLARIERMGESIGNRTAYFFGASARDYTELLSSQSVVRRPVAMVEDKTADLEEP